MFSPRLPLSLTALSVLCASCGSMESLKTTAGNSMAKVGEGFGKVAELTTAPFGPGIPVVEAREKDLKDLPSGQEKAMAYKQEQQRRRGFWIFGGPVDFEEPTLPEEGGVVENGLLPPKL